VTTSDQRLEELEIKMMELENSVHELNQVIIRQGEEIDSLRLAKQHILAQLASLEHTPDAQTEKQLSAADEAPPPHY